MIERDDKLALLKLPAFQRFLFDLIQRAGIFEATANGTDGRNLFFEGRRSLGLEILRDLDEAQPAQLAGGIPVLTLIQLLREVAQSTPKEKPVARRHPHAELDDEAELA
ncbi:hypothetical protein QH494_15985 [Sphingomonas sp. AR_OL41]|uniref:Bbp19 family protein n=1 Tax=Sphingomonas sp. AR_OL41 TaxID=3042729 RepID=UPI00247FDB27|nr:hypothetical protein [Sphingomonas sp. AR_OL41]MDH7973692.1 hypothetical protein [Sphingomonas sp. AR_OL41]